MPENNENLNRKNFETEKPEESKESKEIMDIVGSEAIKFQEDKKMTDDGDKQIDRKIVEKNLGENETEEVLEEKRELANEAIKEERNLHVGIENEIKRNNPEIAETDMENKGEKKDKYSDFRDEIRNYFQKQSFSRDYVHLLSNKMDKSNKEELLGIYLAVFEDELLKSNDLEKLQLKYSLGMEPMQPVKDPEGHNLGLEGEGSSATNPLFSGIRKSFGKKSKELIEKGQNIQSIEKAIKEMCPSEIVKAGDSEKIKSLIENKYLQDIPEEYKQEYNKIFEIIKKELNLMKIENQKNIKEGEVLKKNIENDVKKTAEEAETSSETPKAEPVISDGEHETAETKPIEGGEEEIKTPTGTAGNEEEEIKETPETGSVGGGEGRNAGYVGIENEIKGNNPEIAETEREAETQGKPVENNEKESGGNEKDAEIKPEEFRSAENAEKIISVDNSAKSAEENLRYLRDNWITVEDDKKFEDLSNKSGELKKLSGSKIKIFGVNNKKISELEKELEDRQYTELKEQRKKQKNLGFANVDCNDFRKFDEGMRITKDNIETADKMWNEATFFDDRHRGWIEGFSGKVKEESEKVRDLNHKALERKITDKEYIDEMLKTLEHTYDDFLVDKAKGGGYEFAPFALAFITAKMNLSLTSKDKISSKEAEESLKEIKRLITHFKDGIDPYRRDYLERQFGQLKASIENQINKNDEEIKPEEVETSSEAPKAEPVILREEHETAETKPVERGEEEIKTPEAGSVKNEEEKTGEAQGVENTETINKDDNNTKKDSEQSESEKITLENIKEKLKRKEGISEEEIIFIFSEIQSKNLEEGSNEERELLQTAAQLIENGYVDSEKVDKRIFNMLQEKIQPELKKAIEADEESKEYNKGNQEEKEEKINKKKEEIERKMQEEGCEMGKNINEMEDQIKEIEEELKDKFKSYMEMEKNLQRIAEVEGALGDKDKEDLKNMMKLLREIYSGTLNTERLSFLVETMKDNKFDPNDPESLINKYTERNYLIKQWEQIVSSLEVELEQLEKGEEEALELLKRIIESMNKHKKFLIAAGIIIAVATLLPFAGKTVAGGLAAEGLLIGGKAALASMAKIGGWAALLGTYFLNEKRIDDFMEKITGKKIPNWAYWGLEKPKGGKG